MISIEPLGNRIVVQRDAASETTATGLVKPNVLPQNRGVVLAVGPKVEVLKVGDRVQFSALSGIGLADLDEDLPQGLVMMREDEVLARISAPETAAVDTAAA